MSKVTRLPKNHASVAVLDVGARFELSEDTFNRWWYALLPEVASEFVHLYQGTILGARFVCALDMLTNVEGRAETSEAIARAYCVAKGLEESETSSQRIRYEAQVLYEEDSTRVLIDAVRYHAKRIAETRIVAYTTAKIEELYRRAAAPIIGQEGELSDDMLSPADRLDTEKLALDASIRFLGIQAKERATDAQRRDKRAAQTAINAARNRDNSYIAPPGLEEAKQHMAMLKEALGETEFALVMEHAKALLPPSDDAD